MPFHSSRSVRQHPDLPSGHTVPGHRGPAWFLDGVPRAVLCREGRGRHGLRASVRWQAGDGRGRGPRSQIARRELAHANGFRSVQSTPLPPRRQDSRHPVHALRCPTAGERDGLARHLCPPCRDVTSASINEQGSDADRRKDEFIAVLAHELRNRWRRCGTRHTISSSRASRIRT